MTTAEAYVWSKEGFAHAWLPVTHLLMIGASSLLHVTQASMPFSQSIIFSAIPSLISSACTLLCSDATSAAPVTEVIDTNRGWLGLVSC